MVLSSLLGCSLSASAHTTCQQGLTIEEVTQFQYGGNGQTGMRFVPEVLACHWI